MNINKKGNNYIVELSKKELKAIHESISNYNIEVEGNLCNGYYGSDEEIEQMESFLQFNNELENAISDFIARNEG